MNFLKKSRPLDSKPVQTYRSQPDPFAAFRTHSPLSIGEMRLYEAMRESVPVIDAAVQKIIRLTGEFTVTAGNREATAALKYFCENVRVGANGLGIMSFVSAYLDQLLTYGNALGEVVPTRDGSDVAALYNASLEAVEIRAGKTPLQTEIALRGKDRQKPIRRPELVLFSALNPPAGEVMGVSLLRGLPFVSSVLLKIFQSVGQNFERMGNLRYAVTYKPPGDGADRASARERAMTIAREWADAMAAAEQGQVKDFIAVGDVDIRVIGADNQIIDSEIPVRQLLEQIVAKLSLPPFLLGFSWSTSERMSTQQADILTSELEYYRRLLSPVVRKICRIYLRLRGLEGEPQVEWDNINMQDEVEFARARLYSAQAEKLLRTE
ncbi:MAG: serine/threonine protein phosphatase [Oscillospiraceae bacterium]|nr:serine/threonine protein phosphatase [Oscillospiraceae bacterium]